MTRLCVGNLSSDVTQGDLRAAFAAYGPVRSAYIMMDDSDGGGSKSLGFIEMSWQAHAVSAVQGLDGSDLRGRAMHVSRAHPQREGGSRGNPPRGWDVVGGGRSY
jgi:RNA recognition motif-containing protein